MAVDADIIVALKATLDDLGTGPGECMPAGALAALAAVARPGLRLRIDLEASRAIGAPLVTLAEVSRPDLFDRLTRRQEEVADLMIAGQSNRQIADKLGISLGTVKDHVHAILQRLDLPSRQAVMAASRN